MATQLRNVLISEPHAVGYPNQFLPYMWAVLKSYWERHGASGGWQWLEPIFLHEDAPRLLAPYQNARIDVLGLSCYFWNWRLQCWLAREVKARHPECVVVAGGPEPDFKDPGFFLAHPYIDAVAAKDGEITFTRILSRLEGGERDLCSIPGLYLRGPDGAPSSTGPAEVPTVFDYSPYLDQRSFYERLVAGTQPGSFHATLETNRGCPYSCSFCDWGSSTMSKVRRFEMSRVEAEIDWLGRMKVGLIFASDANFGILARDLEIADRLNDARRRHGFPTVLYYSAAKNNPDRAIEIAKKFASTGICQTHTLAIQHTDASVLSATDRANISAEKQVEVARALLQSEIPIDVQLILGIPGDTYELWKSCLADLMERGIHEEYWTFFYHVLPNAPAAEKAFVERWQYETIERFVLADAERPWRKQDKDVVRMSKGRLIVKSKTFSREDWVNMWTYTACVKALHNASLTRLVALYLRFTHGVSYREFYETLVEGFFAESALVRPWRQAVLDHYRAFLTNDDALDRMQVGQLPGYSYMLTPNRWLVVQLCLESSRFFAELEAYLSRRFPRARCLASVVDYQRNLVILPSYDRRVGKKFRVEFDWVRYFAATRGRTGSEALAEPEPTPGATVEVGDQFCGEKGTLVSALEWGAGDEQERWIQWINQTVVHRNSSARNNFQQVRLEVPGLPDRAA
jgi:putative methyltransferase